MNSYLAINVSTVELNVSPVILALDSAPSAAQTQFYKMESVFVKMDFS